MMAVTGFILAGGQSSRMGRDKALLSVPRWRSGFSARDPEATCRGMGQWLLIELVIERLRPHVERLVVIGNASNSASFRDLKVDAVLTDLKPNFGPLMGLYTGLMHSETPLNLFVPCDMPWVEAQVIERLLNALEPGIDMVASRAPRAGPVDECGAISRATPPETGALRDRGSDGRVYPFPLLCHLSACRIIGALLDRRALSLYELLHQPGSRLLTISEPELLRGFTNVNTLADYVQLSDELTVTSRS
ncbi:MAG: molybdenum cofactor guanylyltransferase [Candidatus Omnitrophica bacterium]|nr:molybdenum cofactor guanylyltransferase [Candidatus Omnitrophota bacterium]